MLLASFFPARGDFVPFFDLTTAAIALLFFMHGASCRVRRLLLAVVTGGLHLWVMCSTFVLFPILGVLVCLVETGKCRPDVYSGFVTCDSPATVQSAIAFTSMAGGNFAAAVCSALTSSLLGIFVSPLLVRLVVNVHGAGGSLSRSVKLCCNCCCRLCWGVFPAVDW
ncbi:bile acid:sodium symporter [Escherichia coli]